MGKYDTVYDRVLGIEGESILSLRQSLDRETLDRITDLLLTVKPGGHKVITAGCGTSGIAARKIAHTLSVVEVPSFYLSPANSIHGGTGAIQKGDTVVLLTKGGNTPEIINYLPICKKKGAFVIGVTANKDSILAKNSDIVMTVQVEREPCPWNLISSGSILAVLAAWDAIAFAVMEHSGYTKEDLYLTHPGGGVGQSLAGSAELKQ